MSLLDDIRAQNTARGPRCSVAVLLEQLDPQDADDLHAALADPHIPSSHIHMALRSRGHHIEDKTIARHRRGACRCP